MLPGRFMERDAGRVEIFSALKQLFNRLADLERRGTWNAPGPTVPADHRADVFDISVKALTFKV